ncbi:unnamed protein product [Closterium sp. Yama58-4]|nr:unnamed protein product [Closterium sp. Yama58-4]
MQAEYARLLASDEQPTPKKLADSIEHLVTTSRAVAHKLREFRGLEHDAELTYIDLRIIEAVFNDDRDPVSVRERAKAFVELAAAGFRGVNVMAKNVDELVASEPPKDDFRRYLMEFAHSEGWVLDRGFYNYVGAPDAREDYKHAKLPGRIPDKFQQASHIGGADAARSRQRLVTELSHAAPATPAVSAPGGRGPAVAANGSVNGNRAPPAPAPAMNAALTARLRDREREIADLNARLREARRTGNMNVAEGDADTAAQRHTAPATTRQRVRESTPNVNQGAPGPLRDRVYTPFVAQALDRETANVRGKHGPPTEQLIIWADNLENANKFIPGLLNGLKDAVASGIKLLVYSTRARRMSFWPSPDLIEATMARALRLRTRAQRHQLHLVWTNDAARAGWFIRKMQVFRNTRWEQGRAYVYILNGLPYEPPAFSRVALPADMTANGVAQISRQDFVTRHRAGPGTYQLLAWHVLNGLPFAADSFERGLYKSFRRASPPPLVLRTYVIAFWLYGVEYPLINGTQMPRSAPQNDEAVRWYHDRVVEWARRSIMASTPATGPWWDPNARAWAFRQGSSVIISEDGLEDISPLAPPLHPFPAAATADDGDDDEADA